MSKNKLSRFLEKIKKVFRRFPVTISVIVFTTLFISIILDTDFFDINIAPNIICFLEFFGLGSFFSEAFLIKNKKVKIFLLGISCIISVVFVTLINVNLSDNANFLLERIVFCYSSIIILSSIYVLYKKSNKTFEQYILEICYSCFKTSLVYLVLSI